MVPTASPLKEERSLGELISQLTQDVVTLVRQEMTLAKTELSQKVSNVGKQVGMLVAGGALAYAGVLAIVASLVMLVAMTGLPLWASALIVGVVVTAIGGMMVKKGLDAIRQQDFVPRQTLETLKELPHG